MLDTARLLTRYTLGLRTFLGSSLSDEESIALVRRQANTRQSGFLQILRRGVYQNRRSPYRKLLDYAGLSFTDVEGLVFRSGVEGALRELADCGVYLTIDEFKCRVPIRRGGALEIRPQSRDFDNPLLTRHYDSRTGGSRGARTRLVIDLELLNYEAAQLSLFLSDFELNGATVAMWRELPPGVVGIKNWLRYARLGKGIERWFVQRKELQSLEDIRFHAFTLLSAGLGWWWDRPLPRIERVSLAEAGRVAQWMARKRLDGKSLVMDTGPSTGAAICRAAAKTGVDISGSFFRFSAEPYTPAKARLVETAGCRAANFYSASEVGHIGLPCASPEHVDEVHLMTDKVAMILQPRVVGGGIARLESLLFTTILRSCPKVMLNVELGDYASVGRRSCGCLLDRLGFHTHLHEIRSFEKLTSGGSTFLGAELLSLVEVDLPTRFGGTPIDYQFVEEEEGARTRVSLLVSPQIGVIDEPAVLEFVLERLEDVHAGRMMAHVWRGSDTLRVVRSEPLVTGALKLLPLHLIKRA